MDTKAAKEAKQRREENRRKEQQRHMLIAFVIIIGGLAIAALITFFGGPTATPTESSTRIVSARTIDVCVTSDNVIFMFLPSNTGSNTYHTNLQFQECHIVPAPANGIQNQSDGLMVQTSANAAFGRTLNWQGEMHIFSGNTEDVYVGGQRIESIRHP